MTGSAPGSVSWRSVVCRPPTDRRFRAWMTFPGPVYHTGEWPHERVDFFRPAGRGDRHRFVGHTGDPDHRRTGRRADGLSAHPELRRPGLERKARSRLRRGGQGRLPGAARQGARPPDRVLFPVQHRLGAGRHPRGARASVPRILGAGRAAVPRRLRRPAVRQGGQRHHRRVRPRQDTRRRQRPGGRRAALPG